MYLKDVTAITTQTESTADTNEVHIFTECQGQVLNVSNKYQVLRIYIIKFTDGTDEQKIQIQSLKHGNV